MTDWRTLRVARDRTHHLWDGAPAYVARFDDVLSFHEPGLAAARDGSGAFHVTPVGAPAYATRYVRTFGFYEGLAAVAATDGWCHVGPDGVPAYADRFAWVGNFQGGRCVARTHAGDMLHLTPAGVPAYAARWAYVGDFREGSAVAKGSDGLATHIRADGDALHGRWFLDLDVFHKGFARARDERGWHHVDEAGRPLYDARYASVEPFYNGAALVERQDGSQLVVDERGATLHGVRGPRAMATLAALSGELVAFWRTETIAAAVEAGLFERLPLDDEAVTEAERRVLDALAEIGLAARDRSTWRARGVGERLRAHVAGSLVDVARYWAGPGRAPWRGLGAMLAGEMAPSPDPFAEAGADPGCVRALHAALGAYAEEDYAAVHAALDPGHRRLVDAGGSTGALAKAVLRARPELFAVVMDRPEVAAMGEVPPELVGRLTFAGGDLFAPWPISGDAVVLARVLHDWPDDRAVQILRRARGALVPGGRLYVVELLRSPGRPDGALLSLHMLLATGGRERTRAEIAALFDHAGFALVAERPLPSVSSVLVAIAT